MAEEKKSPPPREKPSKESAARAWELPHETPDYAGGRGFTSPKAAEALEAARVVPEFHPTVNHNAEPHTERAAQNPLVSPLHTFQDDIAINLKTKRTSFADIAQAEQQKQAPTNTYARRVASKRSTVITFAVLFVVLGSLALGAAYLLNELRITPPDTSIAHTLIAVDHLEEISLENIDAKLAARQLATVATNLTLPPGSIAYLAPTKPSLLDTNGKFEHRVLSLANFLESIDARPPNALVRALDPYFLLGVHATDRNRPFLLLKVTFFEQAFSQMFSWEDRLPEELGPLLGVESPIDSSASQMSFNDVFIQNRDARALSSINGESVLFYTFLNQETLLIATSEETLREVFSRLTSVRIER